jgi:hypothetical protein
MKAIVLSCDKYRPVVEHMLLTYQQLWPDHPFTFRIPYEEDSVFPVDLGSIEPIKSSALIKPKILGLIKDLPDDEWVYWCIDDKFLIEINPEVSSHLVAFVENIDDPSITGIGFCRCRRMCGAPFVSKEAVLTTDLGIQLLRRFDFNQIWLHQLLRVKVLRELFESFPDFDFKPIEMDEFTAQGDNAQKLPVEQSLFVTQQNFMVLGESARGGKLTKTFVKSMKGFGKNVPANFEILEDEVIMGGCKHLPTKNSICHEFK